MSTAAEGGRAQPAPLILAIETAGSLCSAAIGRGDALLAAACRPARHGHAEILLPMIERVTADAGIVPRQLGTVAVATGPGGFTGIRVGLAAAHGIALALKVPLLGVTGFEAAAARLDSTALGRASVLLIALDSRRAELFVQLFAIPTMAPLGEAAAVLPEHLAGFVADIAGDGCVAVAGDAVEAAMQALEGRCDPVAIPHSAPDAPGVMLAARRCWDAAPETRAARPFYLRPPDVTLPKRTPPVPAPEL